MMLLLNYWIIIFLLICIDLAQSQNLISGIFLLDRLNLAIIHMVNHNDFFLHKVDRYFCNLLFGRLFGVFLKLSRHLLNTYFSYMVVIIVGIFSCIDFFLVSLNKSNTLRY